MRSWSGSCQCSIGAVQAVGNSAPVAVFLDGFRALHFDPITPSSVSQRGTQYPCGSLRFCRYKDAILPWTEGAIVERRDRSAASQGLLDGPSPVRFDVIHEDG